MEYKYILLLRLFLAIIISIFSNIFYFIFSPLTVYGTYLLLKILNYTPILEPDSIITYGYTLNFVPACTAASAYYLLTLLIILTKDIKLKTAILMWLLGSFLILAMNLLRISILIIILITMSKDFFSTLHLFFWKIISSIYVFIVWVALIIIFKIKTIPILSDIKYLLNIILKRNEI